MSIRVHPILILLFAVYALAGQLVQVTIIFALVTGHELAHIAIAKAQGVRVTAMELSPIGGTAQCEDTFEGRRWLESSIALAGPTLNMMLLFAAQVLRWQGIWAGTAAEDFIRVNFWLAAFNLIPVLPLDGGRIVRALACGAFGFVRTTRVLAWMGCYLGVLAGAAALYLWWNRGLTVEPVWLSLLAVFFWLAGRKEIFAARIVFLRQLTRKKEELNRQGMMGAKWLTVRAQTPLVRIVEEFVPDRYAFVVLDQPQFAPEKVFTETEIVEGLFREGIHYTLGKLGS
jgi:stage IV sporulation protein FB